jgi:uncharacterized coiled-coil protein SlyX
MTDKSFKAATDSILEAVAKNTRNVAELNTNVASSKELIEIMHQRIEDMSRKFDEILNGSATPSIAAKPKAAAKSKAKPKAKPNAKADAKDDDTDAENSDTESSAKTKPKAKPKSTKIKTKDESTDPVNNIMTYFKQKYNDDNTCFDKILEENQATALFEEHSDDLKSKKGVALAKAKVSLLYKNITKAQKKKIREKMTEEHEALSMDKNDDITHEDSDSCAD